MFYDKTLTEFVKDHGLDSEETISYVSTKDLYNLKSQGYTVENMLDYLSSHFNRLLHGSRTDISNPNLKPNQKNRIYATNYGSIAILKAVFSNWNLKGNGLRYPIWINEHTPLELRIEGLNKDTIGDGGFVYVINSAEFFNHPPGSWQYINTGRDVPIQAKIEVEYDDFKYPVIDVDNKIRIK